MSNYRKGRVFVLAGMLGFASLTVLAGTAAPAPIKVGKIDVSYSSDFPKVKGKMKNVLTSACVNVRTQRPLADATPTATFKGDGPLDKILKDEHGKKYKGENVDGTLVAGTANVYQFDLSDWLPDTTPTKPKLEKKGYHIEIRIGDKHKKFWILASGANTGCDKPAPEPPAEECKANHFKSWSPTGTQTAYSQDPATWAFVTDPQTASVTFDNVNIVDPDSAALSVDGTDIADATMDPTTGVMTGTLPSLGLGTHTITAYAETDNGSACSEMSSTLTVIDIAGNA